MSIRVLVSNVLSIRMGSSILRIQNPRLRYLDQALERTGWISVAKLALDKLVKYVALDTDGYAAFLLSSDVVVGGVRLVLLNIDTAFLYERANQIPSEYCGYRSVAGISKVSGGLVLRLRMYQRYESVQLRFGVSKSIGRVHLGEDGRMRCSFHCRSSGAFPDVETATTTSSVFL